MNNNLTTQKPDPKGKAIASLLCGIVSVIPSITIITIGLMFWVLPSVSVLGLGTLIGALIENIPLAVIFFLIGLLPLVGLILGIMGLKSTKRNFAIVGIVLCIIGLVVPILYFVFY